MDERQVVPPPPTCPAEGLSDLGKTGLETTCSGKHCPLPIGDIARMGSFRRVQPAYQLIVGVAALVLLFVTLYFYGQHVWTVFGGPTVDDSAISYAYAHSIAKGHGVRLSPGTHPVEGFSNALEVLALVPFAMADWNLDLAAKGINLAFLLAGMLAWGLFLWRGLTLSLIHI